MVHHPLVLTTCVLGTLMVVFIETNNVNISQVNVSGLQANFGVSIGLPLILFKAFAGMAASKSKLTVRELIKSELWKSALFIAFFASDLVMYCTSEITGVHNASWLLCMYSFRYLSAISWTALMTMDSISAYGSQHWILDPFLHATIMVIFASTFQVFSIETFLRSSHANFNTIAAISWCFFFVELLYISGYWLNICWNHMYCSRWFEMDIAKGCYLFLLSSYITCDGLIGLAIDGSIGIAFGLTSERVRLAYSLQSAYITAVVVLPTLISTVQALERYKNALEEQVLYIFAMHHLIYRRRHDFFRTPNYSVTFITF